jgi:hypothetical protein
MNMDRMLAGKSEMEKIMGLWTIKSVREIRVSSKLHALPHASRYQ